MAKLGNAIPRNTSFTSKKKYTKLYIYYIYLRQAGPIQPFV